ncbi:hypothetical protein LCGC14_1323860 [marine sediment metagenome]|uniref:Uncharacterized protein n=1 Tax=marine sediment metagenome TaxID=412755 RepID=A0A0F9L489_9ZZZZ
MNAIENEALDLANNIKDTIARGIKSHDERVERAAAELREIQNRAKEVIVD